jgi:organic radical activating enzyme
MKTSETVPFLKVSEIFYSLQGEGARKGTPTVFIRLSGCSAKHACYASGIRCDTEFESGREISTNDIFVWLARTSCREITWTGGEPADQLTNEIVHIFKAAGYFQAIETSGLKEVPSEIDFICVSPKVAEHVVAKNFPRGVSELRYVRHSGQDIPKPSVKAEHYWLSPHSDGFTINSENVKHCIQLCLDNPKWKLSIQDHKLWNIL